MLSFKFFDPPKEQDGYKTYGILKVRGSRSTEEKANKRAEEVIKKLDSVNQLAVAEVGKWVPISNNPKFFLKTIDVSEDEKTIDIPIEKPSEERERKERDFKAQVKLKQEEVNKGDHLLEDPPI